MLAFTVLDRPDVRIVEVAGDIDGSNADALELACSNSGATQRTVVDLLACPYIDSTGLTALIKVSNRKALTIVLQPASRIYRIFAITELLNYFTVAASVEEALAVPPVPAVA